MSETAFFLMAASVIGSLDVGWWHLYRFRLYRQPGSVLEETTHLVGYGLFLAIALVLLAVDDAADARWLVLGLFAANLVVTTVDVLAEPASRAPLGGLPRLEYLVHILAVGAFGAAAATFWWSAERGGTALAGGEELRVAGAAAMTTVLLAVETTLFVRSRRAARSAGVVGGLADNLATSRG